MIRPESDAAAVIGWRGARALSPDGRRVGDVAGLIVDRQSGRPLWLLLHTPRVSGYRAAPLPDTLGSAGRVHVPWSAATILRSPPVPADGSLSARTEQALCTHYRVPPTRGAALPAWERRRTTGLAAVAPDGEIVWEPGPRYDTHVVAGGPGAVPTAGAPLTGLHVLVADHHTASADALHAAIEQQPGLHVGGLVRSGPQAVAAALAARADVLVAALQLPLLDGLEVRDRVHAASDRTVSVLVDATGVAAPQRLDERTMVVSALAGPRAVLEAIWTLTAGRRPRLCLTPRPAVDQTLPLPAAVAQWPGLPPVTFPPVRRLPAPALSPHRPGSTGARTVTVDR